MEFKINYHRNGNVSYYLPGYGWFRQVHPRLAWLRCAMYLTDEDRRKLMQRAAR